MSGRERDGKYWKRRREDAGLEQADAAERVGLHRVTLSRYERNIATIPGEVREKLERLYRVDVSRETSRVADVVREAQREQLQWVQQFALRILAAQAEEVREIRATLPDDSDEAATSAQGALAVMQDAGAAPPTETRKRKAR